MNNVQLQRIEAPSQAEWMIMKEQTQMLIETGFLPPTIKKAEQAMAVILIGRELGIGVMQALNNIVVIQGKPTVSPQLMLALIQRSGQLENIVIQNKFAPDGAIHHVACTMKRRAMHEHTEIFGAAEANKMGLLGKDNYKKQAATMFKWRAVAACARVVFPDIILGLYTPDEMGADVEISDTEEITAIPEQETRQPVVVKMPVKEPEPVFESAQAGHPTINFDKPDYTDEWNQKLNNPTVKKEISPVTPETKGRLLAEGGFVARNNLGYEVTDTEDAKIYQITQVTELNKKIIKCTCANYRDAYDHGTPHWRCAHIHALSFHHQLKQAA